ncbi:hypothetical protein P154DRAFT_523431 [Amniculicola lignicola CBS 123094]|uniref:BTB domain-containing protein n=1 Tax=Amniculicola lignicola CBS 123094 TaxID=1392246 RepID=A0A6A5WC02_9PLEO|nr:hypothetical protein P154DRAFT_523431 [Amniculicola lignicola CBS 123094]
MAAPHHASTEDHDTGDDLEHVELPSQTSSWELDVTAPDPDEAIDGAGPSTPHVSLFAPGRPLPSSSQSPPQTPKSARALAATLPTAFRSTHTGNPSMTKRPAHPKAEQHSPMAQMNSQLPRAQKDTDDPTTPVDSKRSREARGQEYTTLTTLSRLFAGDATMMPASRTPSYSQATGPLYVRATNESMPLPDHLYSRGLLEGRHSDITILAFGQQYNLHRLILDRAPFFTTALSEPWLESHSREVPLHPEEIDSSITKASFELAIKKLYGYDISKECDVEAIGLFATGCWLEMQDLIDASIESILRQMSPDTLGPLIRLVTSNYYGRSGDRILESAKAMLSRNGWEMPLKYWDDIPGDTIRELVASDGFFVHSEWDRWVLTKRLLDRRLRQVAVEANLMERGQSPIPKAPNSLCLLAIRFDGVYRQNSMTMNQNMPDSHHDWIALYTTPDVERILVLLDEGIHYMHMDYEQLNFIRKARDIFGLPVMPEQVISNAMWRQLELRQKVLSADDASLELGLCKSPPEPVTTSAKQDRLSSKGKEKAISLGRSEEPAVDSEDESESWDGNGKPRKFWIPSSDCNIVLGNGADPVVTTSSSFQRHATRLSATMQPEDAQWATDFASSPATMAHPNAKTEHVARPLSAGGSNAGQPNPIAYTEFPPFRFSAEFQNPRFLKEKKRVYSRTVSYAGSLWNIYIQKVRSAKNVQLGVYLHRAKEREGEDGLGMGFSEQSNRSIERIGQLEREMMARHERRERRRNTRAALMQADRAIEDDTSGSGGDVDTTLISTGSRNPFFTSTLQRRRHGLYSRSLAILPSSPQVSLNQLPTSDGDQADSPFFGLTADNPSDDHSSDSEDDDPVHAYPNPSIPYSNDTRKVKTAAATLPPYVDGRPTIKTYFKIYSPSKGGRMLSIYESAPDRFNFSQSWGWKSSTLMLDEVALSGGSEDGESPEVKREKRAGDGKLRFMVVIGNL